MQKHKSDNSSLVKYLENTILKMLHIETSEISNTAIVLRFLLGYYGVLLVFSCWVFFFILGVLLRTG